MKPWNFRRRQFIILITLVTTPLLIIFLVAVPLADNAIYRRTLLQVETISESLDHQIHNWIEHGTYVARELNLNADVRRNLAQYESARTDAGKKLAVDNLRESLKTMTRVHNAVWAIDLLNPQTGDVFVSTLFAEEEQNYAAYDYFRSVLSQQDESVSYFVGTDKPTLYITIPLRDGDDLQAIGVVQMNLSNLDDILHAGVSLMPTGRAYLINQDGNYLTRPRYRHPRQLLQEGETEGARQVSKGINGISIYENIDGESVLGVYRWLSDFNVGLVVELDEDSYAAQTAVTERWIGLVALIMLILAIIASRLLNRYLTAPLMTLSHAAKEFQAGNFAFRLDDIGNDEFGDVARTFNQMADKVQKSHEDLSTMVEKRTAELVDSNIQLRQEIENRIQAERNFKSSENKFRTAFFTSPDAVSISRLEDGLYIDVNDSFIQILGHTREEVIGKTSSEINLWTDAHDRVRLVKILQEKEHVENLDVYVNRKDGSIFPVLISAKVIALEGVPHLLAITRDITQLKMTQNQLKQSEVRYRTMFENSPISLWEEDLSEIKIYLDKLHASGIDNIPDYLRKNTDEVVHCSSLLKVLDVNQETLKLFKAETKEALTSNMDAVFLEDEFKTLRDVLIAFWRGESKFEVDGKWKTFGGTEFYGRMQISIVPPYLETWGKVLLSVFDITPQVQARESLDRRNQELSVLNRIISASVVLSEPESILELSCRELTTLFDVPHAVAFLVNDQRSEVSIVAEYRAEDNANSLLGQSILINKNPLIQYLANHQAPMLIENVATDKRLGLSAAWLVENNISSLMISPLMVNDIVVGAIAVADKAVRKFETSHLNLIWGVTDQLSGAISKMNLTRQNKRLIAAVEQIAESIIITNIDTSIIYVNPAFEKTTHYEYREIIGKRLFELYVGEVHEAELEERRVLLLLGKTWQGHIESYTKNGDKIIEEEIISPLRNKRGEIGGFISVRRDVTRERQLEEQYHQAQKMEAIGRLTGGISHDFNNILTAINGFAELMLRRPSTDEWQHKMAQNILNSGQKAADLVRQLLIFSRKKSDRTQIINLNDVVSGMEKILSRVIGENVEIDTQMSEDLWNIEGDATQFEQVILNLAVNARDAIIDSGHLILRTENLEVEPEYIRVEIEIPPGNYVLLTVSDDGVGMSEDVKAHIFEPFYTTKESHRGTGLGLATVYGIIQQSGGFISVDSVAGQGTSFKIYIPATEIEIIADAVEGKTDSTKTLTGHETILLAEDEDLVREMAKRLLEQYGYTVLEAVDGIDALRVAEDYPHEIHLLLTDVVMPKLNGIAMSKQFSTKYPNTPILYISGYMDDILQEQGISAKTINFLAKPFSPDDLLKKIRTILDSNDGA